VRLVSALLNGESPISDLQGGNHFAKFLVNMRKKVTVSAAETVATRLWALGSLNLPAICLRVSMASAHGTNN
jgi:hypothetical protein